MCQRAYLDIDILSNILELSMALVHVILLLAIIEVASYYTMVSAAAKSFQSCPTLCDPIDGSPPGSSIHGILQERTLEWVAISFPNAGK